MNEENKPDPDELLKAILKQEKEKELGQLKIFFGMSAGVGKTYAMLEEAQQKLKEGIKVIIGTVNTHGRKETEALLQNLPIIPEKWVNYKDTVFEELDLETILITKPDLVIVDELAHTNVPGSKHLKRWQDVIEILDAGIDVYTTLNVQHLESRKDVVESLTGIQIRETVPDLILERASSIELIDIPPPELLRRLKEGKVYLGSQSRLAAENFFQEENLMALREIALRFTAEKVDHDLHGMLHGKGWKTRERLMVAINPAPSSEQLIRAARRLAFELDAPWIVVYVDTGVLLGDQDQARLNRYFNLARELGAEVLTTHEVDIATALQRIANQKDVTRLVIGRPPKRAFSFWNLFQGSLIDRLENENKHLDIVIMRQEALTNIYQRSISSYQFSSPWSAYALALAFGVAITGIGFLISPWIGYKSVGFFFLFGILILSFFVGRGPIFFAAILSAICWNFLFIPPILTPTISDTEDITLVIVYFFVAAILGVLTSRMREQELYLHRREERAERLYEIERDIANATNLQYLRLNVCSRLEHMFSGKFDILTKSLDNELILDSQLPLLKSEKEQIVANWVFKNGKVAGWSTDTLPASQGLYFPIKFSHSVVGVLVYFPKRELSFSMEETNFIETVAQQLGIYIERYVFEERINRQSYTSQIERMHKSIFHSLNRSFYVPLDDISQTIDSLKHQNTDPDLLTLINQLEQFIAKIKFTVDNIITISELESGFLPLDRRTYSLSNLVEAAVDDLKILLNGRPIDTDLPSEPHLLSFDFELLKAALKNLIVNAYDYSPPNTPILIEVEVLVNEFRLSVIDEGAGVPEAILPLIFEKFYHSPNLSQGLGIGLAIVRAVVGIHHGCIQVQRREEGGTEFSLILPI